MTSCVFFAEKSVIAREFLLEIDTSLAIATSGKREGGLQMGVEPVAGGVAVWGALVRHLLWKNRCIFRNGSAEALESRH